MLPLCPITLARVAPSLRAFSLQASLCFALPPSQIEYQGVSIDLSQPFRRATMLELVREGCGLDLQPALEAAAAAKQGAAAGDGNGNGNGDGDGAAAASGAAAADILAEAKAAAEAALQAHPDKSVRKFLAKVGLGGRRVEAMHVMGPETGLPVILLATLGLRPGGWMLAG